MTKPTIEDCFIGNYPETQGFGDNPKNYAQFGLKGHDGIDFGCPSNTQVIAATQGQVIKVAQDPNGYGNFIEILDDLQLCATLYAHLDHAVVSVGDRVIQGQLIGLSDNTGNSTGPHLHFGFCLTDANGIRLYQDNGYFGWLDPNVYANWVITNPSAPASLVPPPTTDNQVLIDQLRADRDKNWGLYQSELQKNINDEEVIRGKQTSIDELTKENLQIKTERDTAISAKDTATSQYTTSQTALKDKQTELDVCNGLLANRKDLLKWSWWDRFKSLFGK